MWTGLNRGNTVHVTSGNSGRSQSYLFIRYNGHFDTITSKEINISCPIDQLHIRAKEYNYLKGMGRYFRSTFIQPFCRGHGWSSILHMYFIVYVIEGGGRGRGNKGSMGGEEAVGEQRERD